MNFDIINGQIGPEIIDRLEADEAAIVNELSARTDTKTMIAMDGGRVVGYAVFGYDDHGMIVVYAARSINHFITSCAMKAFFGVAQILGNPLRVHADALRGNPMARMMGADKWLSAQDSDGVKMAVFNVK